MPANDLNLRLKQFALYKPSSLLPYWSLHYTDRCSSQTFYVPPTRWNLKAHGNYFSVQHQLNGFYNQVEVYLLRGTDWVRKYGLC
jgi:hypothetical protein